MSKKLNKESALKAAELLSAIGEANRLRIIDALWNGKKNVTQLSDTLGLAVVNVSHHLSVLKSARLVKNIKEGRFVWYTLSPDVVKVNGNHKTLDLGWCTLSIS
ncbi:MAG: metalloregulator ArsR/SmtB family transcription factor [Gemmataceae bacterium]|jgi:ArsR family transcriptional regulator|nr:metalloregulator ArsR/SmtB family transcription factor [Gemmataceae bacterium]